MVLRSPFHHESPAGGSRVLLPSKPGVVGLRNLASPLDRFLAFAVDCLVQIPLISLFAAPFRRYILEARLLDQENHLIVLVVFCLVLILVVGFLYQVLCLRFFSATPGKLFFGLRVESISGEKPLPWGSCWLRTIIWFFQAIFLFIPHFFGGQNGTFSFYCRQ